MNIKVVVSQLCLQSVEIAILAKSARWGRIHVLPPWKV